MQSSRKQLVSSVSVAAIGLVLLSMLIGMSACNTTQGLGEDIEKAGAGLKNSADRNGAD